MTERAHTRDSGSTSYTVKKQPKVEILEARKDKVRESSWVLSVLKLFITGFMSVGLLVLMVASKLSIIAIGQQWKGNGRNCTMKGDNKDGENERAFVMLILIMMIPQLFSLLKSVGNSAFCSSEPWPSKAAAFWGILSAVFEVFGLCLFTLVIVTQESNEIKVVILMNGIFLVPIGWQIGKQVMKSCTSSEPEDQHPYHAVGNNNNSTDEDGKVTWRSILLLSVSLICALGGCGYAVYLAKATKTRIAVGAFMLFVSIAWCPKIRKLQIRAKKSSGMVDQIDEDLYDSDDRFLFDSQKLRVKTARERMTAISSLVKLLLTPAVAALYAIAFGLEIKVGNLGEGFEISGSPLFAMFIVQLLCSFFAQIFGWLACTIGLQKICFALPLILSTPLSIVLIAFNGCNALRMCPCSFNFSTDIKSDLMETIALAVVMWLAQILSTVIYIWQSQQFLMAKEEFLFWLPSYDGVLVEQHFLLNRKSEATDDYYVNYRGLVKESTIYICTTMYHEADFEMEQLLKSIAGIDGARRESQRSFESHIWLDDGARGQVIKWYALQLLSLFHKTLGVEPGNVGNKLETPYGMQLRWRLPGGMPLVLHLKDNHKVKNKKRWSQVMYMSYILDFKRRERERKDDLTYILTTDADVEFSPDDVSALMDLMIRNHRVGAVCGRTRPMGAGPLVWYQIFDYAVGHWLLKVANHVFGSVLCSPGCFSVYRATALRDVLPLYSTGIDSAVDFLTKDMGEDRWLCTLMVEAGWRLEYSAAAENRTYCPDNFDEFFKQRRRWGPSTIANQVLLIDQQKKTVTDVGGYIKYYDYKHNNSKSWSYKVGNQTVKKHLKEVIWKEELWFAPTTWYLFAMIAFFIFTALLHGFEFMALIHGMWYLLCLPSGYLLLTIYSVANLTDRSWGTREAKVASSDSGSLFDSFKEYFKHFCWCCLPPSKRLKYEEHEEQKPIVIEDNEGDGNSESLNESDTEFTDGEDSVNGDDDLNDEIRREFPIQDDDEDKFSEPAGARKRSSSPKPMSTVLLPQPIKSAMKKPGQAPRVRKQMSMDEADGFKFPGQTKVKFAVRMPRLHSAVSVEEFLPRSYHDYAKIFKENGYDNVSFIYGLKEKDLIRMGIRNRGHRKRIMMLVDSLPPEDIEQEVPEDVEEWLTRLGLEDYWSKFKENSYTEPRDLADLKFMDKETLKANFEITKEGHLSRIFNAVKKLQYPTAAQTMIRNTRKAIDKIPCKSLETENMDEGEEHKFWSGLRELCLLPEQAAFSQSQELKEKLSELRDTSLGVLVVGNVLWLTFMLTVMNQGAVLTIFGSDFLSVGFLFVYALILVAQIFAMVLHRGETWIHLMARTPFRPGRFIRNWSFKDSELPVEPDQETLEEIRRRWRRRSTASSGSSPRSGNSSGNGSAVSVADGPSGNPSGNASGNPSGNASGNPSGNQAVQTSIA
eukprot:Seg2134.2 transcript_id=Seg2134.2/GoldUCD/mRNA.D3Y31 product="Chitin synthase chs-2" protein_id=Seg2134.2/GoldUCD/D3Y31